MRPIIAAVLGTLYLALSGHSLAAQETGQPGRFDHYVLSLSWSPSFCESRPDARPQCTDIRPPGFVLHGLWPQYADKGWPQDCGGGERVPGPIIAQMLPIMPAKGLILHEWKKHGTCSGLSVEDYFGKARQAFGSIHIPPLLQAPSQRITLSQEEMTRQFVQSNPGLHPNMLAMTCQGAKITEVRICLDKNLGPTPCGDMGPSRCQGGRGTLPAAR